MDAARKQQLIDGGINVYEALTRVMDNENLLVLFLNKFPTDPNYGKLTAALAAGAHEEAITACHTLKGLCGNLSITGLFDLITRQLGAMRADDWQTAEALMADIAAAYERAVKAITAS